MPHWKKQQRINHMSELAEFLDAWEHPDAGENHEPVVLYRTDHGNINSTGELGNYAGHALTCWHPQFEASLEPGVRELILLLNNDLNWITYTSCEGHCYDGIALMPTERHVGLLPRSVEEANDITQVLRRISAQVNRHTRLLAVHVTVQCHQLYSDGHAHEAIDLFFSRKHFYPWRAYFRYLDSTYRRFLQDLTIYTQRR